MQNHWRIPPALAAGLLIAGLAAAPVHPGPPDAASGSPQRSAPAPAIVTPASYVWLDVDGQPLPIQAHRELQEFLRTAEVVDSSKTEHGKFGVRQLRLEKTGVTAHAAGRTIAVEDRRRRLKDREVWFFRDHYIHEPAAYALSELLELGMVPPAVQRTVRGKPSSVQLWVENGMVELEREKRGLQPPDSRRHMLQLYQMRLFDNLINNIDRNMGNIVIDPDWRLWLIDHSRAFIRDRTLRSPQQVRRVERRVWERLRSVSDEDLDTALEPYLGGPERAALLERRRLLVDLIERKIAQVGEDGVLFSW